MNLVDSYKLTASINVREISGDPLILVNPVIAKRVFLPKDPNHIMRITLSLIRKEYSIGEMLSELTLLGNLDENSQKILRTQLCSFISRLEGLDIIKRCKE